MGYITESQLRSGLVASKNYTDSVGSNKVDKVAGKGLSTEDYTSAEKTKLGALSDIKSVGTGLSLNAETGELTATGGGTADAVEWNNVLNKPTTFYDDTTLAGRVTANETAIATLNGSGAGSVSKAVSDAIDAVVDGAPATFDTLKELADWISDDQTGAAAMAADIAGKIDSNDLSTALADYTTTADLTTLLAAKADAADVPEAAADADITTMITEVFGS